MMRSSELSEQELIQASIQMRRCVIPHDHLAEFCRPGAGDQTCRYIVGSRHGLECAKHTDFRHAIDKRMASGEMRAQGDNCPGIRLDGTIETAEKSACS